MDKKRCSKCKKTKFVTEYKDCFHTRDGLQSQCKNCQQKQNQERSREKRTGFSVEEYTKMFEEQKGCCAICGTHQSELKKSLSADHCHTTFIKRGLLCYKCNMGLGLFNDSIEVLKEAIKYLRKSK